MHQHRARTCLALGISPADYDAMTPEVLGIWVEQFNRMHKK